MKLKISVSKQDIMNSRFCTGHHRSIATSCAIALALKHIWPNVFIGATAIFPRVLDDYKTCMSLPLNAKNFIYRFDNCSHEKRARMKPFEFEIEIADELINEINIDNERQYFNSQSKTSAS